MQWIAHYGYVAIFSLLVLGIIGLPIPDETLLLFVGYLIYKGQLRAIPSLASAFLGSLCGITLSYAVGRTF
ncbi:MAG TPA: DedA family protein, partial [Vicinamibacteria bacterium]|nr:DedA family protein [Vicinamibacteria bacterium]